MRKSRSQSRPAAHDHVHESLSDHDMGDSPQVISRERTLVSDGDERTPLLRKSSASSQESESHSLPEGATSHSLGGHGHGHGSMNMRALLLHVFGDALGNVGVIATGLVIWLTEWKFKYYFDPIISLVITVIIFSSALPLGKLFLSLS